MKLEAPDCMVSVTLPAKFVDALLSLHGAWPGTALGNLQAALAVRPKPQPTVATPTKSSPFAGATFTPLRGKYLAEFLGVEFSERTLPYVFAAVVNMTAVAAPEALDRLSEIKTSKRRYIGRSKEAVHFGNKKLPVMQTSSGWWISKNIGQDDLRRALRELCRASGLTFGVDVKFQYRG